MTALAHSDTNKLIGILSRLSSDFEGERAAAGLLATRFIKDRGLGWQDILQPALPPPERESRPSPPSWKAAAREIVETYPEYLTDWEARFLRSLFRYRKISDKQLAVLRRLAEQCGVEL